MKNLLLFVFRYTPFIPMRIIFKLCLSYRGKNIFKSRKLRFSKLFVLLNIGDLIQYWMYVDGAYEVSFVRYFFNRYQNSKGAFIDVGANLGTYSLNLISCFDNIYAVEASSNNVAFLKAVAFQNGVSNLKVCHNAIFNKDNESITLVLSNYTCGCNSLYDIAERGDTEKVQTITLDTLCEQNNISDVRFLKIDVEGAEWVCVQGGKRMISQYHPDVWCEFNSTSACQAGYSLNDLYNFFIEQGYSAYELIPKRFWRSSKPCIKPFNIKKLSNDDFLINLYFTIVR